MGKYIIEINGIDLLTANAVQCACLIFNVENVHPAIISKVEKWRAKQTENSYWKNPLHC